MERTAICFGTLLLFSALLFAQQQKPPSLDGQSQPQRPTLGKVTPSVSGPTTASTQDARQLLRVRTVYIETIDNRLSQALAGDLARHGPFRVADKRADADAVLGGTCFDLPHLKRVHSEVFLTGRDGKSIWQDIIRTRYNPPPLSQAVSDTARVIVRHLNASVRAAASR